MKKQKTLNVDQELIDALAELYPGVPFTKLVENGLKLLLNPDLAKRKVTLDDDTNAKFERLCTRMLELHKHVLV